MRKNYALLFLSLFIFQPSHGMLKVGARLPSFSQLGSLLLRRYSREFCENKFTALKEAILSNDVKLAERLLNEGAWVRTLAFDKTAPIHVAARVGNPELLALLRAWNTSLDITDENLKTPLHIAAELNNIEFVKALLSAGAYHSNRDINLKTPIHRPSQYGFEGVVSALLAGGAVGNVHDDKGLSPLWYATQDNRVNVMKLLLARDAKAAIEFPYGPDGNKLMHVAAHMGFSEALFLLLKHDANVHSVNDKKETPLHLAVRAGHESIIHDLMFAGANAHTPDQDGVSPLVIAAKEFPHLVEHLEYDKIRR